MARFILSLFFLMSFSWGMERSGTDPSGQGILQVVHIPNQKNLNQLYDDVQKLIQDKHVRPEKIAVVLDVNRTLYKKKYEVPEALDRVKDLAGLGVLLVISSANNDFKRTVKRLIEGGLSKSLDLNESALSTINPQDITFNPDIKLHVYRLGKVASVKVKPISVKKFIHKAFSVFAVYGEKARSVEYVFFADDTPKNIEIFKRQTQNDRALGESIKQLSIYQMNVD